MKKAKPDSTTQAEKFKQAARDLGCDENEALFDERLKKVAQAKPKDEPPAPPKEPKKAQSKG